MVSCLTGKFNFQRAAVRSGRRLFALHSFREGRWSYGNILGVVSILSCTHRICRSDYSDLQKKMTAQPEKLAVICSKDSKGITVYRLHALFYAFSIAAFCEVVKPSVPDGMDFTFIGPICILQIWHLIS